MTQQAEALRRMAEFRGAMAAAFLRQGKPERAAEQAAAAFKHAERATELEEKKET